MRRWKTPLPGPEPLLSLADMVERIEAERLQDVPPACPTCDCSAGATTLKWCPGCKRLLSVLRFSRDRSHKSGRQHVCADCSARRQKQYRARVAVRAEQRRAS